MEVKEKKGKKTEKGRKKGVEEKDKGKASRLVDDAPHRRWVNLRQ